MTAAIYLIIIAVWAVVLVPMWLHHHDVRQPRRRSRPPGLADQAISRLMRRTRVFGIPLPTRAQRMQARRAQQRLAERAEVEAVASPPRHRRSAAARRRMVLAVLLTILVAFAVAVGLRALPALTLAAPVTLIVLFLSSATLQVRRARRSRRTRSPSAEASVEALPARSGAVDSSKTAAPRTWIPTSTPLPSYLTTSDGQDGQATTPGSRLWTAAAMLERAQQERARLEREAREDPGATAATPSRAQARIRTEQAAGEIDDRDSRYLSGQAARWRAVPDVPFRRASSQ